MSIIHSLAEHARGHLSGLQAAQRDWSPFLVHFTNWKAMAPLRAVIKDGLNPQQVVKELDKADQCSFEVAKQIAASLRVKANSPSQKDAVPPCVCLSECTLPGLISHAERYGRFGFVFTKAAIDKLDGAPCMYLLRADYAAISKAFKRKGGKTKRLWGLANLLHPVGKKGGRVQDYSHEREWRVFKDIDLKTCPPVCLLAPATYTTAVADLGLNVPVIPIDMLHAWGA
ncbi:MAG: hypothetical protein AB7I19_19455 [Planctomycetota bacterium]